MRYIIILAWVCMFQLIVYSSKGQENPLAEADQFMQAGLLQQASVAYESVMYSYQQDTTVFVNAVFKKVSCLKALEHYEAIPSLLLRIKNHALNDSLKFYYYYERALSYYLMSKYDLAEQSILPVFNLNFTNNEAHLAAVMLYAFTLNELTRWNDCSRMLQEYVSSLKSVSQAQKDSLLKMINESYSSDKIPKLKSVKKARLLSLFFPGLGQAYNGDYDKGLINLSFNAAAVTYIVFNIINTTYFTAASAGVYVFLYFYFGGVNQNQQLVPQKNSLKKNRYNESLKSTLLQINNQLLQSN